ncbi:MAG: BolA family transcriptional regulator [Bacteriovoracaceae bacterium]|nr:BolA family transcriptional regulator [Bacteriovoracaceae bacterium]
MTNNLNEVKEMITSVLTDAVVQINDLTGTHDHLDILVASDAFKDKMLLEQHRMIMDILKESLKEKIHAVKIKTMTHQTFNEKYNPKK